MRLNAYLPEPSSLRKSEETKNVFVSRGLAKEEIAQQNAILKKRLELISAGASRESLSIRNLTLYKDGKKYELIQEDQ